MAGLLDYNKDKENKFGIGANWQEKKKRGLYGLPTANVPNVEPNISITPTPVQPQPDNTMNTLQSLMSVYQSLQGKPAATTATAAPELQAYKPVSLEYNKPAWTEQAPAAGLMPQTPPVAQTGQAATEQPAKAKGLWDYWKQPVWEGGMPLDQFVTLAGMLAHSIAPESAGGRMGAGLAGMAGPIYKERMAQEAEAAKVKEPQKPQIMTAGQRLYGIGGTAEAPVATALTPEPAEALKPRYVETIKDGMYGELNPLTQEFYPVREATMADKARIVEKKKEEIKSELEAVVGPSGKPELRRVSGIEDKPYTPYYKPEKAGSEFERENKELTMRGKAANLAGKKMAMKYGKDAFFVNTMTGDTFMNPSYGTPEQRQAILEEWEQETEKLLPKSMRSKVSTEQPKVKTMETMPPAAQHKGAKLTDTVTGKKYRSDGTKWVEIK